jgi:antitoxin YefM
MAGVGCERSGPRCEVRDHFSEVVDRVEHEHDRVTVTPQRPSRRGHPQPRRPSPLEEALEILGDPEALSDLREGDAASRAGDVVRGSDTVRSLGP